MVILKGFNTGFLKKLKSSVVTLGVFDGVHLGHQKIIRQTVLDAEKLKTLSIVITFESHPKKTTHKKAPLILTLQSKKDELIKALGVDILIIVDFNRKFSKIPAERFITDYLVKKLKVRRIVVGYDYRFGRDKKGDEKLLETAGRKYGFTVHAVDPVNRGKKIASSTAIRKGILKGDLDIVAKMLGRDYSVIGKVVKGDHRGKALGFPTANIRVLNEVTPLEGVYAVRVKIGKEYYGGACSISRPTFDLPGKENLCPEVFIFNFRRNIYGKLIEVFFIKKIRDSRAFSTISGLQKQIAKDIDKAKRLIRDK